jgi:hypothetical protein
MDVIDRRSKYELLKGQSLSSMAFNFLFNSRIVGRVNLIRRALLGLVVDARMN